MDGSAVDTSSAIAVAPVERVPSIPGQPHIRSRTTAIRDLVEFAVHLGLAVLLFRTFVAEGFMISTGSMAPCLLGYHHQVICPSCSFRFPRGMRSPPTPAGREPNLGSSEGLSSADIPLETACPNCGLSPIDMAGLPPNEGDQLLVHKQAYDWRPPRRWELAVFHSPQDPQAAFVKRIVGLPGETIEIRGGDVYADGVLQRKSLDIQRSLRIPVYDLDHPPTDDVWQSRWVRTSSTPGWSRTSDGLLFRPGPGDSDRDRTSAWIGYRHWQCAGGGHRTSVSLEQWPHSVPLREAHECGVDFDAIRRKLSCLGVLSDEAKERLEALSADPEYRQALAELAQKSHHGPITDTYGYNSPDRHAAGFPVHDLMLAARFEHPVGAGCVVLRMHDGWQQFDCELDYAASEIRLRLDAGPQPVCRAPLPPPLRTSAELEMSVFDRQVLVAVDGVLVLPPFRYPEPDERRPRVDPLCGPDRGPGL